MTKEKRKFQPITSGGLCGLYKLLRSEGEVYFPLAADSKEKAESIVASINSSYFGHEMYRSPEEKAVAYFYFIINDHVFTDGNKRTATLCFLVICEMNNLKRDENIDLDTAAVFMEKVNTKDHQKLINELAQLLFE